MEQATVLWPDDAVPLFRQWQQYLRASALTDEKMNDWHQGMMTLQQLSEGLSQFDEQKGNI